MVLGVAAGMGEPDSSELALPEDFLLSDDMVAGRHRKIMLGSPRSGYEAFSGSSESSITKQHNTHKDLAFRLLASRAHTGRQLANWHVAASNLFVSN